MPRWSAIKDDRDDRCYLCGRQTHNLQIHHMLHGCRRPMAEKYRLTVHLCPECHTALHDRGTGDRKLEEIAQRTFEKEYSRELWMRDFQKNYLDQEEK